MANRQYNNLCRKLFQIYAPESQNKNVVIGMDAIIKGFLALYHGTGGTTRQRLDSRKFKEKYSSTQSSSSTTTAICLLSRSKDMDGSLNEQFETAVKRDCTEYFLHSAITEDDNKYPERRINLMNRINSWFKNKTRNEIDQIVNDETVQLFGSGPVTMCVQSVFKGTWENSFTDEIRQEEFFLPGSKTCSVQMMINNRTDTVSVSDLEKEHKATIVQFPYMNPCGSFVAIMPNEPSTPESLLQLLSTLNLTDLFMSFEEEKCEIQCVPKFTCETELILANPQDGPDDGLGGIEDLKDFKDEANFSNMFPGGIPHSDSVSIQVKTTIDNHELGTRVKTDCLVQYTDGEYEDPIKIVLNKPFLYFILNNENYIRTIGMFVDPSPPSYI